MRKCRECEEGRTVKELQQRTRMGRISRRALLKSATAGALALAAACGGEKKAADVDTGGTDAQGGATTPRAAAASGAAQTIAASAIVVVMDTLRADHVGAYGNDWIKTPTLDALAKEGIVFTHAFTESLPTIPMSRTLHPTAAGSASPRSRPPSLRPCRWRGTRQASSPTPSINSGLPRTSTAAFNSSSGCGARRSTPGGRR
jgi:hypothetical protein